MHACPDQAIAAGTFPLLPAASAFPEQPPWHADAQVRELYATIDELGIIAARLTAIDLQHRFLGIADAGARLGRLVEREVRTGFGQQWTRALVPSNGASAVSQLWDQLASIREAWMTVRMRAAGHRLDHHDLPGDDPAWAAWDTLEAGTPDLAEARGLAAAQPALQTAPRNRR